MVRSRASVSCARLGCGAREGGRDTRIEAEAGSLSEIMFLQGCSAMISKPLKCYRLFHAYALFCIIALLVPKLISEFHIQSIHLKSDRNINERAYNEHYNMHWWFCLHDLYSAEQASQQLFHPFVTVCFSLYVICLSLSFIVQLDVYKCFLIGWFAHCSPLCLLNAHRNTCIWSNTELQHPL